MGIRGLYTYIKKNLSNSDVIECVDLRDRTVFVDGDGFVQWIGNIAFANTPFAELPRVEHTLRSESFHLFTDHIIQLIDRNTVVFVFDVPHVHYELKREKKKETETCSAAKGKRRRPKPTVISTTSTQEKSTRSSTTQHAMHSNELMLSHIYTNKSNSASNASWTLSVSKSKTHTTVKPTYYSLAYIAKPKTAPS